MPSKPRRAQIPTPFVVPGMEAKTLEFRSIEDEQEKAQRLRKEMLNFYVKDVMIWAVGS